MLKLLVIMYQSHHQPSVLCVLSIEPLACITDSWAQGAVPVQQTSILGTSREEVISVTEKEELVNNSDTEEKTAENAKEEEFSEGIRRDEECMLVGPFFGSV